MKSILWMVTNISPPSQNGGENHNSQHTVWILFKEMCFMYVSNSYVCLYTESYISYYESKIKILQNLHVGRWNRAVGHWLVQEKEKKANFSKSNKTQYKNFSMLMFTDFVLIIWKESEEKDELWPNTFTFNQKIAKSKQTLFNLSL